MTPVHPLTEVQNMIERFLKSKVTAKIDIKRISQLTELAQQEIKILNDKIKKSCKTN